MMAKLELIKMISYLDGTLIQKSENNIIIEVNGIGYEVLTNKKTILSCPKENENVKIYTSLIHKEDSMILCGFSRKDDRDLFKILLTSIPRDYYVVLPSFGENAYDKLTHAGYHGVGESVKAIEKLLDTDINYYAKVNFSTIEKVVDAIDGIDVKKTWMQKWDGKEIIEDHMD